MRAEPMRTRWVGLLLLVVVAGCTTSRERLKQSLLADRNPVAHARDLDLYYRFQHPDVIHIEVEGHPHLTGDRQVGLDGRVALADGVFVAVDGLTSLQATREVANRLGVQLTAVHLRGTRFASQHLYLFGEVGAKHQVVDYRGPETVVDLLQRIGGPAAGAALSDIRVVRANVAAGKPPEVFHVNLDAILNHKDMQTNIRLEPFDRIHIGQTPTTRMRCYMPPWFRLFCNPETERERKKESASSGASGPPPASAPATHPARTPTPVPRAREEVRISP